MEKESIVLRISKHNLYRGIKIALSLAFFFKVYWAVMLVATGLVLGIRSLKAVENA